MGRENWCKHYSGTVNATCRAGVTYAAVEIGRGTPQLSLPCFKDQNPLGATCDKCVFRTPEEVAAMKAEQAKRFADLGAARAAIVADCGGPWKRGTPGSAGVIDCPVCKAAKSLAYSRAGYNGHVHAACKTAGCVAWME